MKQQKIIIVIVLIIFSTVGYSQRKEEVDIFEKVIFYEGVSDGAFYVQCVKPKTYFDLLDFKVQTMSDVPEEILKELDKASQNSNDGFWELKELKNENSVSGLLKGKECLTLKDVEDLFQETAKRQLIISISQPIFDSKFEHCVVSVTHQKFTGEAYGKTYFLKKVYGIWAIIITYDLWMT